MSGVSVSVASAGGSLKAPEIRHPKSDILLQTVPALTLGAIAIRTLTLLQFHQFIEP